MAEVNRFESRLTRRGGRIIDVEGSISSQGPAISPQGGEGASYTPVNPLPSGEDTAPYMPIAPIAPGEPPQPPAPDQYESWPPRMISLAEGARVDNIAGRPIHEFTGIQPGNINPIEPAAPGAPKVTIGFDSAFSNVVNSRPQAGLSPKPWESGLGTMFGTEASDGISTIGRLPGGARLAPHPGDEPGGSEIGGSTPGRGIVIDDDKRTAPPPKPGPGDEPPPKEKPCDCLLLVDYQEFPPQHGRQKGRRKEGYSDISVQPGSVFFLRFELFDGPEVKKPWNIAWFKHTPAGRAPGPEKSLVFYEGTNAGRMAADNNRPSKGLTSGYTPCPSTITRWVRANEEGKYEIVFIWGNLRCSVKIWVRYDYALGVPQECGCSILCYDLDIKGMPEVDMDPAKQVASANCQIKVDSTDSLNGPNNFGSANFGFTQVLGVLRLTGNDITDKKYHWTLDCEEGYLEFTRDIRLDPLTLKAAPADDAEFKCHDEGDDICGTPIPFIVRPTQKALDEFLTGRRFPLVDKIIGVVGKQRCPIRIVISNFCDKDQLGKYIEAAREPAEVTFEPALDEMGEALWTPQQGTRDRPGDQSFSSLSNGQLTVYERGSAEDRSERFQIDLRFTIELTLDYRWSPPDCCCVFVTKAVIGMKVTVSLDELWYKGPKEWMLARARLLTRAIFQAYEEESDGGFRDAIRKQANAAPRCRKARQSECADLDDISNSWTSDLASAAASWMQQILRGVSSSELKRPCRIFSAADAVAVVNVRDYIQYSWGIPPYLPFGVPSQMLRKASINAGFDYKRAIDDILDQHFSGPLCPCGFLIWVHGFKNSIEEAKKGFGQIKESYLKAGGCCAVIGFAWQSDPGVFAYKPAEDAADLVANGPFAYLIRSIKERCPGIPINLASHSLGARVILRALETEGNGVSDISTVVLASAAVPNECLEPGQIFGNAHRYAQQIHVAYNERDWVLIETYTAAGFFGVGAALGQTGTEHRELTPDNVYNRDFTNDWWATSDSFESHSSVYLDSVWWYSVQRAVNRTFWSRYVKAFAGESSCIREVTAE